MENESTYKTLYKIASKHCDDKQEVRRKTLLKDQKLQRSKIQDDKRLSLKEFLKPKQVGQDYGKKITFQNKYDLPFSLQYSEWLREKPDDLSNWFLVPCPKGQRCFIVACAGKTEVYNKKGKRVFYFHSKLPGDGTWKNDFSILDCIYSRELETFFVLDVIYLGNYNLQHCDASFRRFWLRSRLDENMNYNDSNSQYNFILIDWIDFEDEEMIQMNFFKYPHYTDNIPKLDGFLFYHKDASYTFGTTPLVGWLFSFMIPEVLGYEINEIYALEKPGSYVNYLCFINEFNENLRKKSSSQKLLTKKKLIGGGGNIVEENEKLMEEHDGSLEESDSVFGEEEAMECTGNDNMPA